MNKKTYNAPKANIINFHAELPLALSGNLNEKGKDDVVFESNDKDWNSDSWNMEEE